MRRYLVAATTLVALGCADTAVTSPSTEILARSASASSGGYDALGYNRAAGIFNGSADGIDGVLDGRIWGDAAYASDHLVMKWNSEWDRGNREHWTNPPYDAWLSNEWSGKKKGSSGSVWHYKYKWIGSCSDYETLPDGGYCIWGQFEVLQDHGYDPSFDSGHTWFARAVPGGYGN